MKDYLREHKFYGLDKDGGEYFHNLSAYLNWHKEAIEKNDFTDFVKLVRSEINDSPLEDRMLQTTNFTTKNHVHWFNNYWAFEDRGAYVIRELRTNSPRWGKGRFTITKGDLEAKLFVAIINFSVKNYKGRIYNDWSETHYILNEIFGEKGNKEYVTHKVYHFNAANSRYSKTSK